MSKILCTDFSSFALAKAKDFNLLLQHSNQFAQASRFDNYSLLALTEPGRNLLLGWGKGGTGCLGLGDLIDRNIPTITDLISHSKEIVDVVSGNEHLMAILEEEDQHSVYSWGNNVNG